MTSPESIASCLIVSHFTFTKSSRLSLLLGCIVFTSSTLCFSIFLCLSNATGSVPLA